MHLHSVSKHIEASPRILSSDGQIPNRISAYRSQIKKITTSEDLNLFKANLKSWILTKWSSCGLDNAGSTYILSGVPQGCSVHLRLIGKLVVDFILVTIELFSLDVRAEATSEYRLEIAGFEARGQFGPKFQVEGDVPHQSFFVSARPLIMV